MSNERIMLVRNELKLATGTLLASGLYPTTTLMTMADQTNERYSGMRLYANVANFNAGSAPALSFRVDGKDPVSGNWATLLSTVALVATSTVMFTVHPRVTAVAGYAAAHFLPATWRVVPLQAADTSISLTCSLGYELLP